MPDLIATAAFGLEAVVDRELERLGYADRFVEDGRVTFAADRAAIARANLWLRSADRVLIELGRFPAREFGALFDGVLAIPWEEWLDRSAAIPVEVRAVRSPIDSPRNAQSIVKKAIATRLGDVYSLSRLPETGARYLVDVAIRGDDASIAIDTSGPGLHKRGYRTGRSAAPLKETLAAGMLQLTFWKRDRPLADPFCGSGTIPIEAALIAANIAPGLGRTFAAEQWTLLESRHWQAARAEAVERADPSSGEIIWGSDQSGAAIAQARKHARAAGVLDRIHFQTMPFRDFRSSKDYGCLVCNPPYGERLSDRREVEALYREFAECFARHPTWSKYVLTSHRGFPGFAGQAPDRRRKLYNGKIACTYYQFHGPRPPKPHRADQVAEGGVDARTRSADD